MVLSGVMHEREVASKEWTEMTSVDRNAEKQLLKEISWMNNYPNVLVMSEVKKFKLITFWLHFSFFTLCVFCEF